MTPAGSRIDRSVVTLRSGVTERAVAGYGTTAELDVPSIWHDAALFGSDPGRTCRAPDLGGYLDAFPLLPFSVDIPLVPGEAVYLLRSVRYAWTDPRSCGTRGSALPFDGSLANWARRRRSAQPSGLAARDLRAGLLCLTNQRVVFGQRAGLESLSLSRVRDIRLIRGGLLWLADSTPEALMLLLPDAMLVGLCAMRALRDAQAAETTAPA